jgi:hypothetical protein
VTGVKLGTNTDEAERSTIETGKDRHTETKDERESARLLVPLIWSLCSSYS